MFAEPVNCDGCYQHLQPFRPTPSNAELGCLASFLMNGLPVSNGYSLHPETYAAWSTGQSMVHGDRKSKYIPYHTHLLEVSRVGYEHIS